MKPVQLTTERLLLDLPVQADHAALVEYCRDPLFEHNLTLPWPYRPADAAYFTDHHVPGGWADGRERTWAIRTGENGPLLGVIGSRTQPEPGVVDVGYWLGAPHRGHGYMTEAVRAVVDWVFSTGTADEVVWECVVGNHPSARIARRAGFEFTGIGPTRVVFRDGTHPTAWHGRLSRATHNAAATWPTETLVETAS